MRSLRLLLLSALALAGCGDDSGPAADMGFRPDFGDIAPETPAGIEVAVMPARTYYRTEQTVRVVATVIDIDENVLDAAEVRLVQHGRLV